MKIRSCFVSNSSSSSFVCIIHKEDHERALTQLTKEERNIIERIFSGTYNYKERKFCGKDVLIISGGNKYDYYVKGNLSSEDLEFDEDKYEGNWEYWEEVVDAAWNRYCDYIPKENRIEEWDHN